MQSPPQIGISGGQTHGLFELAQRVPPPPLLHVDPGEVHMTETGAARIASPASRARATTPPRRAFPAASGSSRCRCRGCRNRDPRRWRAGTPGSPRPGAPGSCRSSPGRYGPRRSGARRSSAGRDRSRGRDPPHLVLVGLLPDFRGPVEAFRGAHPVTSPARLRAEGPCPRTSTRSGWSPGSDPASRPAQTASAARRPGRSRRAPPGRRRRTPPEA